MTATKIDDNIKVLHRGHPRDITDAAQYAIDQFVMRGGKMIAFLDPHAYFDQKHDQMAQVLGKAPANPPSPSSSKPGAWTWTSTKSSPTPILASAFHREPCPPFPSSPALASTKTTS